MEFPPFITYITGNSPLQCTSTRPKDEKRKVPKFSEVKEKDPHSDFNGMSQHFAPFYVTLSSPGSNFNNLIFALKLSPVFFHLSTQPVLGAEWSSKQRITKCLPLNRAEIYTQTNWRPHGMESTCLYWLYDVIWVASTSMTSLAPTQLKDTLFVFPESQTFIYL